MTNSFQTLISNVYFCEMYFCKVYFCKVYFCEVYVCEVYVCKVYDCEVYPASTSSQLCKLILLAKSGHETVSRIVSPFSGEEKCFPLSCNSDKLHQITVVYDISPCTKAITIIFPEQNNKFLEQSNSARKKGKKLQTHRFRQQDLKTFNTVKQLCIFQTSLLILESVLYCNNCCT